MGKIKYLYWGFSIIVLIEVLNLVFKLFNPYYFNLVILGVLTLLSLWLGKYVGIKIGWLVTIAVLTLLLIVLLTFVIWN